MKLYHTPPYQPLRVNHAPFVGAQVSMVGMVPFALSVTALQLSHTMWLRGTGRTIEGLREKKNDRVNRQGVHQGALGIR